VARNRKRAKERRVRQGQPVASGRSRQARVFDAGDARFDDGEEPIGDVQEREQPSEQPQDIGQEARSSSEPSDGAPGALEHATPDVELAEAQLATASRVYDPSADQDVEEQEEAEATTGARASAGAPAVSTQSAVSVPRPWLGARILGFVEGSWRELQRVQWPDRRQVLQATGVVIGFVIVASVFLGVADLVASKVVHFILNGHF
jgi:preprotein translocase SecE subunit